MNHFVIASGVLALGLYIPLCRQIWRGTVEQNLATWILWVALDLVALGTVLTQNGNFVILAAYVCGGTVTICCILKSRKFGWTWIESMTAALVLVCIIAWALVGAW